MSKDRDRDDFFERLEEVVDKVEDAMEEMSENQDGSPFGDSPFGGPFGGSGPFGGDNPFGDDPFGTEQETDDSPASVGLFETYEEEDEIVVVADLPGFEEENITISADPNRVRIEAEASSEMRRESVSHVYNLPAEVENEQASATLENGVLTVRLPKVDDDEDQTSITIE
jgi:HSP20 family protein